MELGGYNSGKDCAANILTIPTRKLNWIASIFCTSYVETNNQTLFFPSIMQNNKKIYLSITYFTGGFIYANLFIPLQYEIC